MASMITDLLATHVVTGGARNADKTLSVGGFHLATQTMMLKVSGVGGKSPQFLSVRLQATGFHFPCIQEGKALHHGEHGQMTPTEGKMQDASMYGQKSIRRRIIDDKIGCFTNKM